MRKDNISITNSKLYSSLEEFNKQKEFKDLPSFIPENFKFSWGGYLCSQDKHEKLVVKYYDNEHKNRVNNIGKELWLIYSRSANKYIPNDIQKEELTEELEYQKRNVMQQGTKLKSINIDKYEGYISKDNLNSEEDNFHITVKLFIDDYSVAVSTLSNEDDIYKDEEMIIKIAKSIITKI